MGAPVKDYKGYIVISPILIGDPITWFVCSVVVVVVVTVVVSLLL